MSLPAKAELVTVYYTRIDLGKQSQIVTLLRRAAMCGFRLCHFAGWSADDLGDEKHPGPRYQEAQDNAERIQRIWTLCAAHFPICTALPICPISQSRCFPTGQNAAAHRPLAIDQNFDFSEEGYDYAGCPKDIVTLIDINLRRY